MLDEKCRLLDEESSGIAPEQPILMVEVLEVTVDEVGLPEPIPHTSRLVKNRGVLPSKCAFDVPGGMEEGSVNAPNLPGGISQKLLRSA